MMTDGGGGRRSWIASTGELVARGINHEISPIPQPWGREWGTEGWVDHQWPVIQSIMPVWWNLQKKTPKGLGLESFWIAEHTEVWGLDRGAPREGREVLNPSLPSHILPYALLPSACSCFLCNKPVSGSVSLRSVSCPKDVPSKLSKPKEEVMGTSLTQLVRIWGLQLASEGGQSCRTKPLARGNLKLCPGGKYQNWITGHPTGVHWRIGYRWGKIPTHILVPNVKYSRVSE